MQYTTDQIVQELAVYQEALATQIDTKSLDGMKEQASILVTYLSRSAVLVAEAGKLHNEMKKRKYEALMLSTASQGIKLTPMLAKDYINTKCAEEQYAYDMAERTNKAITHTLDQLRSWMSAEKMQLEALNYQT